MLASSAMVHVGRYNLLPITQRTPKGLTLGSTSDSVFLSHSAATADLEVGRDVRVFVYHNAHGTLLGSLTGPRALLGGFALMRCVSVTDHGAFVDWGLPKDLFVPFALQHNRMVVDQSYVVHVGWDNRGERLVGSSKLAGHFDYDVAALRVGDAVDLLVYEVGGTGARVVVDQQYTGMIYTDATFRPIQLGEELSGYIACVRNDNRLDIVLSPPRRSSQNDNWDDEGQDMILAALEAAGGFLPVHDKSPPEEIAKVVGLSKKAFKRCAGGLYKRRLIRIAEDGLHLLR